MDIPPIKVGFEDGLLTLKELADLPEIRKARITYRSLCYWAFAGLRGRKLPTQKVGGRCYTTAERVLLFALQDDSVKSVRVNVPTIPTHAVAEHARLENMLNRNKKGKGHEKRKTAEAANAVLRSDETETETGREGQEGDCDPAPDS